MSSLYSIVVIILLNVIIILSGDDEYDDIYAHYEGWNDPMTLGSLMKLRHQNSGHFLHSHEISWGSGSQQQSVTAYPTLGDGNSLFQLYARIGETNFTHASAIKCGDIIRLKHAKTGRWLHSHPDHRAPLSHKQEVTCFGDENNSDEADDWKVICNKKASKKAEIINWWRRGESFSLQHAVTKHYLFTSKKSEFNDNNCRGCPILGQFEVSASEKKVKGARWVASHGFYFRPFDFEDNPEKYLTDDSDQIKHEL